MRKADTKTPKHKSLKVSVAKDFKIDSTFIKSGKTVKFVSFLDKIVIKERNFERVLNVEFNSSIETDIKNIHKVSKILDN